MSEKKLGKIHCSSCDREAFLLSKPRFEGFQKVGETVYCSNCGHEFEEGDRPSLLKEENPARSILGEREPDSLPRFLGTRDELRFCMYCREYVEHPFTQRCMKHQREVKATDTCPDFRKKE